MGEGKAPGNFLLRQTPGKLSLSARRLAKLRQGIVGNHIPCKWEDSRRADTPGLMEKERLKVLSAGEG